MLLEACPALSCLSVEQYNLTRRKDTDLILQKTQLGWIIGGNDRQKTNDARNVRSKRTIRSTEVLQQSTECTEASNIRRSGMREPFYLKRQTGHVRAIHGCTAVHRKKEPIRRISVTRSESVSFTRTKISTQFGITKTIFRCRRQRISRTRSRVIGRHIRLVRILPVTPRRHKAFKHNHEGSRSLRRLCQINQRFIIKRHVNDRSNHSGRSLFIAGAFSNVGIGHNL